MEGVGVGAIVWGWGKKSPVVGDFPSGAISQPELGLAEGLVGRKAIFAPEIVELGEQQHGAEVGD